jgi:hypothetical protein
MMMCMLSEDDDDDEGDEIRYGDVDYGDEDDDANHNGDYITVGIGMMYT